MSVVSEEFVGSANQARACLSNFASEVDLFITYNEIKKALYNTHKVPEATAFLIANAGECTQGVNDQNEIQLHAEHEERILDAYVASDKSGKLIGLSESRLSFIKKRKILIQSAVLYVGAESPENKVVDSSQRILTPEKFKTIGESTLTNARQYALTVKNLAELLLFITE